MVERDRFYDEVAKAAVEASIGYDKAVVTIAAGALGLSITFVHDIAPTPVHTGRIGLAWVFLVTATLLSMISFWTSGQAHRAVLAQLRAGVELSELDPGGLGCRHGVVEWGRRCLDGA